MSATASPGRRRTVVGGHGALLLDRQDIAPLRLVDRHEGRAGLRRGDGEAGVVAGQVVLLEDAVGGLDGGDAGEPQLLGQEVLQGAEGALAAPPRLRRISRDMLDAELGKGAPDLGQDAPGQLTAGLGGVEVMAAAIAVEAARQAVGGNRLGQAEKLDCVPFSSIRTAE